MVLTIPRHPVPRSSSLVPNPRTRLPIKLIYAIRCGTVKTVPYICPMWLIGFLMYIDGFPMLFGVLTHVIYRFANVFWWFSNVIYRFDPMYFGVLYIHCRFVINIVQGMEWSWPFRVTPFRHLWLNRFDAINADIIQLKTLSRNEISALKME